MDEKDMKSLENEQMSNVNGGTASEEHTQSPLYPDYLVLYCHKCGSRDVSYDGRNCYCNNCRHHWVEWFAPVFTGGGSGSDS